MADFDLEGFFWNIVQQNRGEIFKCVFKTTKNVSAFLKVNFSNYFEETLHSSIEVNSFFNRSTKLDLREIYQPITLLQQGAKLSDNKFRELVLNLPDRTSVRNFIIIGSAGSGKTMLIKHMFLSLIENMSSKIPFLFYLRRINEDNIKDGLINFFYVSALNKRANVDLDSFEKQMQDGGYIFLLDGLDEVDLKMKGRVISELNDIQSKYHKTIFIITSRPDISVDAWEHSRQFRIAPLSKNEVVSLLKKIPYQRDVKNKFIHDMRERLYKDHTDFSSNPLLVNIMLLTYESFGDVPDKIHIFYHQAFEALFYLHDTLKESGYRRQILSGVPVHLFRDILSIFCTKTYMRREIEFSRSDILNYLKESIEFFELSANEEMVLEDLIVSLCIMQYDGIKIVFTHRSFQEYFCSIFIERGLGLKSNKLMLEVVRRRADRVFFMALDMNRNLVESEWLLPTMLDCCNKIFQHKSPYKMLKELSSDSSVKLYFGDAKLKRNSIVLRVPYLKEIYELMCQVSYSEHYESIELELEYNLSFGDIRSFLNEWRKVSYSRAFYGYKEVWINKRREWWKRINETREDPPMGVLEEMFVKEKIEKNFRVRSYEYSKLLRVELGSENCVTLGAVHERWINDSFGSQIIERCEKFQNMLEMLERRARRNRSIDLDLFAETRRG